MDRIMIGWKYQNVNVRVLVSTQPISNHFDVAALKCLDTSANSVMICNLSRASKYNQIMTISPLSWVLL